MKIHIKNSWVQITEMLMLVFVWVFLSIGDKFLCVLVELAVSEGSISSLSDMSISDDDSDHADSPPLNPGVQ